VLLPGIGNLPELSRQNVTAASAYSSHATNTTVATAATPIATDTATNCKSVTSTSS
jgi:hypothetical protein